MSNPLMCECSFVWGCIVLWLKRGKVEGIDNRVKVWSKDESYDYIVMV